MANAGAEASQGHDGVRDLKSQWEAIGDLDQKIAGAALSVHRTVQEFKQSLESQKEDRHRTGRELTRTPVEKMEAPYLHRKFHKEHTNRFEQGDERFKSTSPVMEDSVTEIDIPKWNEGMTRPPLIDRYIRDKGCGGFRLKMEIPVFDEIECWFHEYMEKEACFGGFYQANNAAESVVVRFKRNLPIFDGFWHIENLLTWIDAIDDFFDEIKPPEHLKCKIVWYKMKGAAYYWWKQIQDDRNGHGKEEIISWPRMRKLLISRFMPSSCSIKVSSEPYMSKTDKKEDAKTETVVEHETNRKYVLHDADSLQIPVQEIKFELSSGEGADIGESKSKPECRNLEILSSPGTITLHSHEHANDVGIYHYGLARNSYLTGSWMHTSVGLEHDFQLAPFAAKSQISWCHLHDSDSATNEAFFTIESTTGSSWGSLGLKRKSWDEIFTNSLNLELGTKRVFYRLLYWSKKHTIQFLLLPSMLEIYSDEAVFLFDPGGDIHLLGNMERNVDGLWNKLAMLSYYRFTVQLCNHFSSRHTDMRKQRGCSYESREAVCPLVYAPADFADLPEFRDPRNVSLERHETVKYCATEYFYTPVLIPPSTDTQLTMQEKGISYWAETCIHFYNLVLVRERLALKGFEHIFMINRSVFTSVDGYLTPFIKRYSSRYLSKIEACWIRGAHFMLLQHLPKVHMPVTFLFDPGGSPCSIEIWSIILLIVYVVSFAPSVTICDKKFDERRELGGFTTNIIPVFGFRSNELECHLHYHIVYIILITGLTYEGMKLGHEHKSSSVLTQVRFVGVLPYETGKFINKLHTSEASGDKYFPLMEGLHLLARFKEAKQLVSNLKYHECIMGLARYDVYFMNESARGGEVIVEGFVVGSDIAFSLWLRKGYNIGCKVVNVGMPAVLNSTYYVIVLNVLKKSEIIKGEMVFIAGKYDGIDLELAGHYAIFCVTCIEVLGVLSSDFHFDYYNAIKAKLSIVTISSCLSVLCTNGQSREFSKLFHNVTNGLDPPLDLDGVEAHFAIVYTKCPNMLVDLAPVTHPKSKVSTKFAHSIQQVHDDVKANLEERKKKKQMHLTNAAGMFTEEFKSWQKGIW